MSLIHRTWSLLPRRMRREALFSLMALRAPRIARPAPSGVGLLAHAGYFRAMSGLGTAARRLQAGLAAAGLEPLAADLTGKLRQGPPGPPPAVPDGPGTLLVHVNGPMLPWALAALGRGAVAGKRVVAVWNWELPVLPADWQRGFGSCHEIWAGSAFTAAAFRDAGTVPVRVVPYPVDPAAPSALARADFGLPEEAFLALQVFDAASSIARKNPSAGIAAHHAAFGDDPRHLLVLKVHNTARAGEAWRAVAAQAAARPNVRVLDAALSDADLSALVLACDVLLSLHRAEGFGFTLAEALALGRPVVATAWSGNVDFMDGPGAHGVPARLVQAADAQATYDLPNAAWADPDIRAAATLLRRIAAEPALRHPLPRRFPAPDYRALLRAPALHP
ncbi:glycosyltransferase [Falsiroseomonas selenitidurans]|uniref:Glycosyltransferase n=1 Tax=Falsiroseomonas selenitidurans TaxID=2716335 RepID=A0ABX1E405_9PROT|nr:glycosyltransferase [Falsiroseomonas selenitidurans]NKC30247.1 glycosyltransferase [Falsiroseomonas selenitidurans]